VTPQTEPTTTPPTLLTVDEAAATLRIGRSLAYRLAAEYFASGGRRGLPAIRLGNVIRVPLAALEVLCSTGRVVCLDGNVRSHQRR